MKRWWVGLFPIVGSLFLYGLSLAVPAFDFGYLNTRGGETWPGWQVLLLGWLGVLLGQFGWLANPLYLVSLILLLTRQWRAAAIVGAIVLVLGFNTLFLFVQKIPVDASGVVRMQLKVLKVGFYIWITSLSIPVLWSGWQFWQTRTSSKVVQENS